MNLPSAAIQCPYCGEEIEVMVDCSVPHQEYIEDCSVCCRPIIIKVMASPEGVERIEARAEDD